MSTIYHKGGISLAQPSPLYSVRNEIVFPPKKTMAPFDSYLSYIDLPQPCFISNSRSLSSNQLSTLPRGLIDGPSKLATLNLDDNPWVCDCRLNWLILWLQSTTRVSRSAASTKLPICMEPFQYQGQRLTSLRPLKCEGEPLIYYLLPLSP